jgi:hypothetical protein
MPSLPLYVLYVVDVQIAPPRDEMMAKECFGGGRIDEVA